jgi:integrase
MNIRKKPKNKILPTDQKILENKEKLGQTLKLIINNEIKVKNKKETIKDKLDIIKDTLKNHEEDIKNKKISYSDMSYALKEILHLKISTQTLRSYCQNHLGFEKKTNSK